MEKMVTEVNGDMKLFRKFYQYVFDFFKPTPQARAIDLETACSAWQVVLEGKFKLLDDFSEFVSVCFFFFASLFFCHAFLCFLFFVGRFLLLFCVC